MPTSTTGMGGFTSIFDAVTSLSTTYADNLVEFETHGTNDVVLFINYTKGTETSVSVKVEVYDAEQGWVTQPYDDGAADLNLVLNMTATAGKRWLLVGLDRFETKVRVSAIANTATTDTSLTIQARIGSSRFPLSGNII